MKRLIYFHGFASSANSSTIKTLREFLPDYEIIAPDIPVDPAEALPLLHDLCIYTHPDIIAGSSMGGMYCQQMFGFKRICVNPAFFMSKYSKVLQTGTFDFLNELSTTTAFLEIIVIFRYLTVGYYSYIFYDCTRLICNINWSPANLC